MTAAAAAISVTGKFLCHSIKLTFYYCTDCFYFSKKNFMERFKICIFR